MNDIKFIESIKNISEILSNMWQFCNNAWEVLSHPIDKILIPGIDMSYWILLLTALICFILTMAGCKKTKNAPMISTIIFIILQCLKSVLVGL